MIRHTAGIAEIVDDIGEGVQFYRDVLGVAVQHAPAAEATFGDPGQADHVPLGSSVGFEVEGVEGAHRTIAAHGWPLAQPPRQEPWCQITSRFFSPSGALCEVSETPWGANRAVPARGRRGWERGDGRPNGEKTGAGLS